MNKSDKNVVRNRVLGISDKVGVYLKGEGFDEGTLTVFSIEKPDLEESFEGPDAAERAVDFARSLAAGMRATAP